MNRRSLIKQVSMATAGLMILPSEAKSRMIGSPVNENKLVSPSQLNNFSPVDHGKALVNPGMGWTLHFYSNSYNNYGSRLKLSDTIEYFPGMSTVYLRLPWAYIEPEEGVFHWEILDTPAQRWIDKGKKVAFRITAQESNIRYATPEWVKNAGAKGYFWRNDTLWEPDFNDPIFLSKLENFVAEMAKRYDNSNVAFVDIGSFGLWGEGHTAHSTNIKYGLDVIKKHIDIHCKYFKNTLLCISDDFVGHDEPGEHFPISDYAFFKGVTIRDDSILVQNYGLPMPSWTQTDVPKPWYHAEMAQLFWPTLPVILEHEHYGASVRRNAWNKELLLQSVEEYHASYMSIHWWPDELLKENQDIIEKINRRLGYRIQLKEITWPNKVQLGVPFTISSTWANAGVAPCYPGGFPCFTLKDNDGGIVSALVCKGFDVKNLQVGKPLSAPILKNNSTFTIAPILNDPNRSLFRGVAPGEYNLFVSVGKLDGTPVYELPYDGNDGYKRYQLGKIELLGHS